MEILFALILVSTSPAGNATYSVEDYNLTQSDCVSALFQTESLPVTNGLEWQCEPMDGFNLK